MKAYTDLKQSKKLAEFLPLETADMYYSDIPVREWVDKTDISKGTHVVFKSEIFAIENLRNHEIVEGDIYAWSLAALLDILPEGIIENYYAPNLQKEDGKYSIAYGNVELLCIADNPIDACYEMIIKLHEQNLI